MYFNYFSCQGTGDDKQVQVSENANESKSIENGDINVSIPTHTNETIKKLESFKTLQILDENTAGDAQIETICLDGHNPSYLVEDTYDQSSGSDFEDDWDDFVADEILDLDSLDLDSDRRSILRDVEVMSVIDELEEFQDSDNNIKQEIPLNVMSVEHNDELITEFTLMKTWKDEKLRARDRLKAIRQLVTKQHSEWARRPTKATLARKRKIREMFPDIRRETYPH